MSALRTLFLGTVGLLTLAMATPAMARDYGRHGQRAWHRHHHRTARVIIINPAPVYQYRHHAYPYYRGYYPYYRSNIVIVPRYHHHHHHR